MYIGRTPNISYSMEISTSPDFFMEISEVNFKRTWMYGELQLEAIPTYIVITLLLMQQNSWVCLKEYFQLFLKTYLSFCTRLRLM